ncbi:MAG: endolytic transglycosylase MltG, partial [Desulfobulbaceae bacterium]|nr:endolytic transglycosylase MltG [Desulfobulbaceae bacterium]
RQIKTILGENGIINDDIRFLILARITDRAGHLRAGEYLIHPGQTPLEILRLIEQGKVLRHQVTIPEGMSTRQIIQILARDKWIKPDRFLALTKDTDFIRKIGFNLESLEGYLFPDTYTLTRDTVTEEKLIIMMTNRFQAIWNDLEHDLPVGLSRHQVITLASIVEKETGKSDERPLIAQVFLNRLKKEMRLQSDPTVIYGLQENFDGDLTREDLQQKNPYNTYVIDGLPPGPVCSPGRDSILAVLHPADVPYLYFVSKKDGSHHFSTSLKDHNRAVRKYQILPAKAGDSGK